MPLLDTLSSGGTFLFCSNPAMVRCGIASCAYGLGGDISAEEAEPSSKFITNDKEKPIASSLSSGRGYGASPRAAVLLTAILRGWMASGQIDAGFGDDVDLQAVLPLAVGTKTLGLLGGGFDRLGVKPPAAISEHLAGRQSEILAINLRALSTISKLAQTFEPEGLPYVVIKGPLRAEQVYGAMDVRFGSDVDVFVDRSDYRQATILLEEKMGYACLVPKDDLWWHEYLGEAPFAANQPSLTLIDLHNQLQQPGGPYPTNLPGFLQNVERRAIGRASARILSAENALMLTAISFGKALRNAEPWIAYAHELAYALHTMAPSAEEDLQARAEGIADEATRFAGLVRSVTRIAALAGIVVLLIAVLFGEEVLVLIGGDDYARAAIVLIPLAFAAAFELASVSYEPLLYSTGNAGRALQMRAAAVVTLVIAVLALHSDGSPVEIGWAVALAMGVFYLGMSLSAWIILRRMRHQGGPS